MKRIHHSMSTGRKLQTKDGQFNHVSFVDRRWLFTVSDLFRHSIIIQLNIIQTNTSLECVFFILQCSGSFQLVAIRIIRLNKHYARAIKIKMLFLSRSESTNFYQFFFRQVLRLFLSTLENVKLLWLLHLLRP